jgi:hypothetical protein
MEPRIAQLSSQINTPNVVLPERGPTGLYRFREFFRFSEITAPVVSIPIARVPMPLAIMAADPEPVADFVFGLIGISPDTVIKEWEQPWC